MNSGNGTYINGQRLYGCQTLQAGDRILLGQNGPEFIFEYQNAHNTNQSSPPTVTPYPPVTAGVSPPPVSSHVPRTGSDLFKTALTTVVAGAFAYGLVKLLGPLLPLALTIWFWRGNVFSSDLQRKKIALRISGGIFVLELVLSFFLGWGGCWWINLIGIIAIVATLPSKNGRILLGTSLTPLAKVQK